MRIVNRSAAALAAVSMAVAAADASHAADAAAGRKKAAMCRTCHGIDGIARIPEAPNIAGESELYLENQLKAFRSGERKNEMMSLVAKTLSDEDIDNLAAWYASIEITAKMPE